MLESKPKKLAALAVTLLLSGAAAVWAVTSATFVFDFVSDPGDLADGPNFDVTGIGPIDDGSGCDIVSMVMVDATGTPTDVDSFCLDLTTGLGGADGDYGSFETGYVPTVSPVTYTLFDLDAADLAALSGLGENDQEYFDYVVANATCLDEQALAVEGLPTADPVQFCYNAAIIQEIPAVGGIGLAALAALLAAAGLAAARRRAAASRQAR